MKIEINLPIKIALEYHNEAELSGVEISSYIEYVLTTLIVMSRFDSAKECTEFGDKLDNGDKEALKVYKEILEAINSSK
ncbi:hypothetical protein [Peptostreptococcus equinus]|uniref:Uncharacterized protein n=1 Tax=Peptostreptococcus equinus TaxID=3003601 RepID=A0ABY7JTN7_9FIRM|nr:hypothetical protein [Peptostreptococcus sp. CBA3647]WAW15423.1 hypothetical protein O0R46_02975 [Peptostreptococcus sp. CBA3647]